MVTEHIDERKDEREKERLQDLVAKHQNGEDLPETDLPSILAPVSGKDFSKIIPREYILRDIVENGSIVMIAGQPKVGKTFVLMHMAICMAAELSWLEIPTMEDAKGSVLWLNLDMKPESAERRIYEISNGIEESWEVRKPDLLSNFYMLHAKSFFNANLSGPALDGQENTEAALQELERFIKDPKYNIKVCFIDNLVNMEGERDENKAGDMAFVIKRLGKLRDETGCNFFLIHHTTKSGDSFRGSGALFGGIELLMTIEETDTPNALILRTDGARDSGKSTIGMIKRFLDRIDDNGQTMTDKNGHPVKIFKLDRADPEDLKSDEPERKYKGKTPRSEASMELNLTKIKLLFQQNSNVGLTQTGIKNAYKDPRYQDCKMRGSSDFQTKCILQAEADGIIVRDGVYYKLPDNT